MSYRFERDIGAGDHMADQVRFARYWFFVAKCKQNIGSVSTVALDRRYINHLNSPNRLYTDIIFVHSEKDAVGFRSDILVAWPRQNRFYTEVRLDTLNHRINERNIDLSLYSLRYPITVIDLVDNWEQVHAVWTDAQSP
jgi:hypothetical protein